MSLVPNQKNNKGGVKTDEGKNISKYNAQKHAILSDLTTEYESIEMADLYNELTLDLKSKGKMQELLVEIIVANTIKLGRVVKSESEYIKTLLSPIIRGEMDIELFKPTRYEYQSKLDCTQKNFQLFSRYQTAMENRIYKALSALKILQQNEQG